MTKISARRFCALLPLFNMHSNDVVEVFVCVGESTYMPKITRKIIALSKHSRGIVIPAVFCEMLELDTGTKVHMELVGSQIIIKKSKED